MVNKKHAYLVIAHNEPEILQATIEMLDDHRNDFYLMIDKKSDIKLFRHLHAQYSKIYFVKNRINIKWGDISQIKAEIALMKEVLNSSYFEKYSLFHIISGVDLPLMTTDEIFEYDNRESNKNFVTFDNDESNIKDALYKTKYYHFFPFLYKSKYLILRIFCKKFNSLSIKVQRLFNIKRHHSINIAKGNQWCSIRPNLIKHIIKNEDLILSEFRYCSCSDELFIQSLIVNELNNFPVSEFGCMRMVGWEGVVAYTYRKADYSILINSKKFFARKFSILIDKDIINLLRDKYRYKDLHNVKLY